MTALKSYKRGPGPPLPGTLAYASDSGPEAPEEEGFRISSPGLSFGFGLEQGHGYSGTIDDN